MSAFEGTLERAAVLAVFMPIIAGQGGNAGVQTLTLVIRAIALGELQDRAWRRLLLREAAVALINGVVIALALALIVFGWKGNEYLSLALGLAMVANMIVAGVAGVFIPATLRLLRVDPALASGIFVTMATDIMGFFSFLGIATLLIEHIA